MRKRRKLKKKFRMFFLFLIGVIFVLFSLVGVNYYLTINKQFTPVFYHKDYFTSGDFGINIIKSESDFDDDGIDDYSDILTGAKKIAEINPKYVNKYYDGGYPPEDEGVCTDVIWYALKEAGYNLKDMMSYDILSDQEDETNYYDIDIRDDNIDFRRVGNQDIFLKKYAEKLSNDIYDIKEFMPGDIVVFDDADHIAIISDKRNENGIPYLIQNRDTTQKEKEEDRLEKTDMSVTGHYRFTNTRDIERLMNKVL